MANKITNIKERVLEIAKYKGVSYERFCESIGMTYGSFKGIAKERPLNSDAIEIIITNNPDINSNWLLTGKGNMLGSDKVYDLEKESITVSELHIDYKKSKLISLYDVSAAAGYGSFDEMISTEKVVGTYIIPDFKNADWMIYVRGSSMYPKYSSGDIIACRVLNESKFIQWNKVYVIATREQGILVKRINESDKENCLLAISDNPAYKPFYIPENEILGIALVVGVIRLE